MQKIALCCSGPRPCLVGIHSEHRSRVVTNSIQKGHNDIFPSQSINQNEPTKQQHPFIQQPKNPQRRHSFESIRVKTTLLTLLPSTSSTAFSRSTRRMRVDKLSFLLVLMATAPSAESTNAHDILHKLAHPFSSSSSTSTVSVNVS